MCDVRDPDSEVPGANRRPCRLHGGDCRLHSHRRRTDGVGARKTDLYILRHGEAGKSLAPSAKDSERPLTKGGKGETEEVALALQRLGLEFDFIVSSPLSRARQTAEVVAKRQKKDCGFELWDELKPEGDRRSIIARLAKFGHSPRILMVGHEPSITTLVGEIIGAKGARLVLKKAGLIRVEVTSFFPNPQGELRWLLSPRVLKAIKWGRG